MSIYSRIEHAKNKINSVDELASWLSVNYSMLYNLGSRVEKWTKAEKVEIKFIKLKYSRNCSNGHSCPSYGVQNWGGRVPGAPSGYAGLYGRIHIMKTDYTKFSTDVLNRYANVATGSGGGGNNAVYDVTIWLDDWPALKEAIEIPLVLEKLKS